MFSSYSIFLDVSLVGGVEFGLILFKLGSLSSFLPVPVPVLISLSVLLLFHV